MLEPLDIPGLFVTGTDTDVGKTVIAGAIAHWFYQRGKSVSVLKPAATGCVRRREGLVSEDAEFLAVCSQTRHPLDLICPQRYAEPLAPSVAARRAGQPLDWDAISRSIRLISPGSDVMIVEGAGGVMAPMDDKYLAMDVAKMLAIPTIVVARPALGTINHTLMSVRVLQQAGVRVAGVVINRYPAESPGVPDETNPREIERWAKVPVLAIVPDEPVTRPALPPGIVSAIGMVDWEGSLNK
jgi:dethiobiotin synthetase